MFSYIVSHWVVVGIYVHVSNYVGKKPGLHFPPSLDSVSHCPLIAMRIFPPVGVVYVTF